MRKLSEQAKESARVRARAWYNKFKKRPRTKVDPAVRAAKRKQWLEDNKVVVAGYKAKYRDGNRDRVRKSAREYVSRRKETDANFKIRFALRGRIWATLQKSGAQKAARTEALVGCTLQFLRGYLEARFQPGMTWENHGEWHIDHRIPCAEFDLRDKAQQLQCFNYTNLQPLWAADNLRKSGIRPPTHQPELL